MPCSARVHCDSVQVPASVSGGVLCGRVEKACTSKQAGRGAASKQAGRSSLLAAAWSPSFVVSALPRAGTRLVRTVSGRGDAVLGGASSAAAGASMQGGASSAAAEARGPCGPAPISPLFVQRMVVVSVLPRRALIRSRKMAALASEHERAMADQCLAITAASQRSAGAAVSKSAETGAAMPTLAEAGAAMPQPAEASAAMSTLEEAGAATRPAATESTMPAAPEPTATESTIAAETHSTRPAAIESRGRDARPLLQGVHDPVSDACQNSWGRGARRLPLPRGPHDPVSDAAQSSRLKLRLSQLGSGTLLPTPPWLPCSVGLAKQTTPTKLYSRALQIHSSARCAMAALPGTGHAVEAGAEAAGHAAEAGADTGAAAASKRRWLPPKPLPCAPKPLPCAQKQPNCPGRDMGRGTKMRKRKLRDTAVCSMAASSGHGDAARPGVDARTPAMVSKLLPKSVVRNALRSKMGEGQNQETQASNQASGLYARAPATSSGAVPRMKAAGVPEISALPDPGDAARAGAATRNAVTPARLTKTVHPKRLLKIQVRKACLSDVADGQLEKTVNTKTTQTTKQFCTHVRAPCAPHNACAPHPACASMVVHQPELKDTVEDAAECMHAI
jgi:hypothetical protein